MSTSTSAVAPPETSATHVRWDTWLFSRRADLALILIPLLLAGGAAALSTFAHGALASHPARLANWTAQNVLGNATHVVLTFLLFWAHPQVLDAAPGQKRNVLIGAAVLTFGVGGLFVLTSSWNREAHALIVLVIFNVFGLHHTLAQHKGFWGLHSMRGRGAGVQVSDVERRLQGSYVPILLVLFMLRLFLIAEPDGRPFLDVGQGAPLPRVTLALVLAAWVGYFALLFRTLLRSPVTSGPKLLYVSAFAFGTWLVLVQPMYGSVVLPGMHGLEYYLLTARMLKPDDAEPAPKLAARRVVPAMLLVMLPIFALGVYSAFLAPAVSDAPVAPGGGLAPTTIMRVLACLSLGVVLAHYYADAFIYRMRLPGVRAAMLPRLRLG